MNKEQKEYEHTFSHRTRIRLMWMLCIYLRVLRNVCVSPSLVHVYSYIFHVIILHFYCNMCLGQRVFMPITKFSIYLPTHLYRYFHYRYATRCILFIARFEFVNCSGIKHDGNTTLRSLEFTHKCADAIGRTL